MTESTPWTARRILLELCDADRRRAIAIAFWRHATAEERAAATLRLAQIMRFREVAFKKAPIERRAEWLLARLADPRFTHLFEVALVAFHTHEASELLAACLDRWGIPHQNGVIEVESPPVPSAEAVASAFGELQPRFARADLLLYFAAAGLLMGEGWAESSWPLVDREMAAAPA
jgi:hypothetical protein